MIATHSPKMFNGRVKSPALSARIINPPPDFLVNSYTVDMRRELWAAPVNAADIKRWRVEVQQLPSDYGIEISLPDINDPQLKQLLVPLDWRNDKYLSVTPVASMGVMHELYKRIAEMELPYRKWLIQPTPAALANHGEALVLQGGALRLLRRGLAKIEQGSWTGSFVQLTARCEHMNVSSGMAAVGFPALTAIGGFVHSLERSIGSDIEFAFGMQSADWSSGVPKIPVHRTAYGSSSGRVKGGNVSAVPGYSTEEVTATGKVVLLLQTDEVQLELLAERLKNTHRLAGGALFDVDVSVVSNASPPCASYLLDASVDIARARQKTGVDSLQAALAMYGLGGEWRDGEWYQPRNGYTLNHTGYALLEEPVERRNSRNGYPHAWVEPSFSLITQGSMSDGCWWSRGACESGVFWKGR